MDTQFDERRWQLFLQLLDKTDLDLKGMNIKDYKSNFACAFEKAHSITCFYHNFANESMYKVEEMKY